jgi:hypothetical protein
VRGSALADREDLTDPRLPLLRPPSVDGLHGVRLCRARRWAAGDSNASAAHRLGAAAAGADAVPARPPLGQSRVERRSPDRAPPLSPPKPPDARQVTPPRREPQVARPVTERAPGAGPYPRQRAGSSQLIACTPC